MSKSNRLRTKYEPAAKKIEDNMVHTIQDLVNFEEFRKDIFPKLQKMIKRGATSKEILEEGRAAVAAKLVTMAVRSKDPETVLKLSKTIFEKTDGPVVQKQEHDHKYSKVSDEQLISLVTTKAKKVGRNKDEEDDEDVAH